MSFCIIQFNNNICIGSVDAKDKILISRNDIMKMKLVDKRKQERKILTFCKHK